MNAFAMALITEAEVPLDADHVRPGLVALGIVLLLGVGLFFLLRSFVKQLKKIDFDEQPPAGQSQNLGASDNQSST